MNERKKRPFKDAEVRLLRNRETQDPVGVFVGWRWPHVASFGHIRLFNEGFLVSTLGLDGVE